MAATITKEQIKKINQLYYEYHNYSKVGREMGIAPTTVKKYVDPTYKPIKEEDIIRFNPETDMPKEFSTDIFLGTDNFGTLCVLSEEEKAEIEILHREMEV